MKHSRPLKELIAELQALEDANPGILCVANDNEWGADTPNVRISLAYVNEHDHLIILDESQIQYNRDIVKECNEKTAKEVWDSLGENKVMWASFEDYEKEHNMIKSSNEEEMKWITTAVPVVVIHT